MRFEFSAPPSHKRLAFSIHKLPKRGPVISKRIVGSGRTAVHPLCTRFAERFGASISEATMRPGPRRTAAGCAASPPACRGSRADRQSCASGPPRGRPSAGPCPAPRGPPRARTWAASPAPGTARAGNRRFSPLSALCAHTKASHKPDLLWNTLRRVNSPGRARTVLVSLKSQLPASARAGNRRVWLSSSLPTQNAHTNSIGYGRSLGRVTAPGGPGPGLKCCGRTPGWKLGSRIMPI
jgi:hypothetical protein